MTLKGDVNRLKANVEKQYADEALGCPQCMPIRTFEVREGPNGETVQIDGSPLPPLCSCDDDRIKRILVVLPDGVDAPQTKEEPRK